MKPQLLLANNRFSRRNIANRKMKKSMNASKQKKRTLTSFMKKSPLSYFKKNRCTLRLLNFEINLQNFPKLRKRYQKIKF